MHEPGADKIVWEHGRRNFELRRDGILRVVCPVRDESEISGVGIFSTRARPPKFLSDSFSTARTSIKKYVCYEKE